MCGWGGLLTLQMRNMWSGQGLASSLDHPALDILEFWSTGNESPVTLPLWGGVRLPPAPRGESARIRGGSVQPKRGGQVCVCVCQEEALPLIAGRDPWGRIQG